MTIAMTIHTIDCQIEGMAMEIDLIRTWEAAEEDMTRGMGEWQAEETKQSVAACSFANEGTACNFFLMHRVERRSGNYYNDRGSYYNDRDYYRSNNYRDMDRRFDEYGRGYRGDRYGDRRERSRGRLYGGRRDGNG